MATARTAKTTKKTTTAKTASKAANKARVEVPKRVVQFQKTVLETQQKAFDRGYDAITGLQERREDTVNKWLERSKVVPEQVADLAELWTATARSARKNYKRSVDKSYALTTDWVDSFARS